MADLVLIVSPICSALSIMLSVYVLVRQQTSKTSDDIKSLQIKVEVLTERLTNEISGSDKLSDKLDKILQEIR